MGPNTDKCLGPGVCAGHGMPADTAVCQFPIAAPETFPVPCTGMGHGTTTETGSKVCAGSGVCQGPNICATCKNDILHHLREPPDLDELHGAHQSGLTASKENLILQHARSMVLLPKNLEDLRQRVRVSFYIK